MIRALLSRVATHGVCIIASDCHSSAWNALLVPASNLSQVQLEPVSSHARHRAWFRGAHLPGSLRLSRKIGSGCHFGCDRRHLIIKRSPIAVGLSTGIGSSWTAARLPGRRASRTIFCGPQPPYFVPGLTRV